VDHAGNRIPPLTDHLTDLHLHSTASDGARSPAEVVQQAARVGLTTIALTDHDTVGGYTAAVTAAAALGVRVMSGTELSVRVPWGEMHLLAYGFDPTDHALLAFMARATGHRRDRGQAMAAALGRLGVPVTFDDIEAQAIGAPIGRPHVARALIEKRVVASLDEAFDRFLGRGRPAYVPKALPSVEEATSAIRAAHGISSAAHLKDRGTRQSLGALKAQGLDAVEVRHPSHGPVTRKEIERLALDLDLLRTGGSDWHGQTAVGPAHGTIGAERVPDAWVHAIDQAVQAR
jgi:predicted metal-dependent phosphoesterase TrpH